tara:strand:+ start:614 stop:847 length:234 start_codon:yes stop_codon:yes gene_type:complete
MNHPMLEQIEFDKLCLSTFLRFFLGSLLALFIVGIFSVLFQHFENTLFYVYIAIGYGVVFSIYHIAQTFYRAYQSNK